MKKTGTMLTATVLALSVYLAEHRIGERGTAAIDGVSKATARGRGKIKKGGKYGRHRGRIRPVVRRIPGRYRRRSRARTVSRCPGWKCTIPGMVCTSGPGYICQNRSNPKRNCLRGPCWFVKKGRRKPVRPSAVAGERKKRQLKAKVSRLSRTSRGRIRRRK